MNKSIEECKNEVAKENGYPSWGDFLLRVILIFGEAPSAPSIKLTVKNKLIQYENQAMQLYASQFQQQVDPEQAYIAGYKKRVEMAGMDFDFAHELLAKSYYIKFKSNQPQKINP